MNSLSSYMRINTHIFCFILWKIYPCSTILDNWSNSNNSQHFLHLSYAIRNSLTERLWIRITFLFNHAVHLKVSHREYIMPTLLYCKFTTFHMLFFMPDVKVSEEIETSTPSLLREKRQKASFSLLLSFTFLSKG